MLISDMGKERRAQQREFDFNAEEAQKARDFSHDEAELARSWQTAEREAQQAYQSSQWEDQFNRQNEYNSPANQAQLLREGGINPAVYFGSKGVVSTNSTGSVSAPSAPSASPPSAAQAHGSAGYPSQIPSFIASVGNFVKDMAGAGLQTGQTYELAKMLNQRFQGLVLDNQQKGLVNKGIEVNNYIQSNIKDAKVKSAWQEYSNLTADYYLKLSQGDKNVSDVALNRSMEHLNGIISEMKGYEGAMLKIRLGQYNQELRAYRQQMLGSASAGFGIGANQTAQAETENILREFKEKIMSNDSYRSTQLLEPEIKSTIKKLKATGAVAEKDEKEAERQLRMLKNVESNGLLDYFDKVFNWFNERSPISLNLSGLIKK